MPRAAGRVVGAATVAYALALSAVTVLALEAFVAQHDLGAYAQYIWLLGHFEDPFGTIALRPMLEDHFEPTFALLAPLGALGLQATGLLVVQAISIAAVAPLLFVLARQSGATGWLGAAPALLWLVSPAVIKANLYDYHPDTFIPALLIGSVVALNSGRRWLFVLLVVLATGTKEDTGLTVAALGVALAWTGRRRLGTVVAVAAGVWAVALNAIALPRMNEVVRENFTVYFAGNRGDDIGEVLVYWLRHPLDTVAATISLEKLGILVILLASTAGLCLLAARWMVVALPTVAVNLLSAYDPQSKLDYHYWLVPIAGLALAGAIGAGRVPAEWRARWGRAAWVCGALLFLLSLGALSAKVQESRSSWATRGDRRAAVDAIPAGAAVSVPEHYFAPLADRRGLYALPEPFEPFAPATEWGPAERRRATADLDAVILDGAERERVSVATLERLGFRPALRRGDVVVYLRPDAAR